MSDDVHVEPTVEEDLKVLIRKDIHPDVTAMAKKALSRRQNESESGARRRTTGRTESSEPTTCASCGREIETTARYCPQCGQELTGGEG